MNANADTLEKAILFAVNAHQGQRRKGNGRPYILHPISVMSRLYEHKKSVNIFLMACAAILHDTVEDCGVTLDTIAKDFGYQIAAIVDELTLDKEMYEKIGKKEYLAQELCTMSSYALVIKLCDRLDNVSDMADMNEKFVRKYTEETHYILDSMESSGRKLTKTHKKIVRLIRRELKRHE